VPLRGMVGALGNARRMTSLDKAAATNFTRSFTEWVWCEGIAKTDRTCAQAWPRTVTHVPGDECHPGTRSGPPDPPGKGA
jgi:hypothetical protein